MVYVSIAWRCVETQRSERSCFWQGIDFKFDFILNYTLVYTFCVTLFRGFAFFLFLSELTVSNPRAKTDGSCYYTSNQGCDDDDGYIKVHAGNNELH